MLAVYRHFLVLFQVMISFGFLILHSLRGVDSLMAPNVSAGMSLQSSIDPHLLTSY